MDLVQSGGLRPMADRDLGGISCGRNRYGAFSYDQSEGKILCMSQLFKTGELWGIDPFAINAEQLKESSRREFPFFPSALVEEEFAITLTNYLKFAREMLRLKPPLRLIAGATDVKGYRMAMVDGFGGEVVDDYIVYGGTIDDLGGEVTALLRPFFNYLWEECGLKRPNVDIYR